MNYSTSNWAPVETTQPPVQSEYEAESLARNIKETEEANETLSKMIDSEFQRLAGLCPEIMGRLNDVRVQLQVAMAAKEAESEARESGPELTWADVEMSDCKAVVAVGRLGEGERKEQEQDLEYGALVRKCLQMIHPDKLHKKSLRSEDKKKLLLRYHEVMRLRKDKCGASLLFIYFEICSILGYAVDERAESYIKVLRLKLEEVERLNMMLKLSPLFKILKEPNEDVKIRTFEDLVQRDIDNMLRQLDALHKAAF